VEDAKKQAVRMLKEHHPLTARRVAAEVALEFPRHSPGREFWCCVVEELVRQLNGGEVMDMREVQP